MTFEYNVSGKLNRGISYMLSSSIKGLFLVCHYVYSLRKLRVG